MRHFLDFCSTAACNEDWKMLQRGACCCLLLALTFVGCANPFLVGKANDEKPASQGKPGLAMSSPLRHSWQRLTQAETKTTLPPWDWVTGIPTEAPRAELLAAEVSRELVARLFPNLDTSSVQLASAQDGFPGMRIINMGGHEVRNCADLYEALDKNAGQEKVQIDLASHGGREIAVATNSAALQELAFTVAPEHAVMRIADQGNPALVIREAGIHAKLVIRVERSRGLLQLALSCQNAGFREVLLPREVRAACSGEPLRCLTVAESLDRLYRQSASPADQGAETANLDPFSFSSVSSRDDYLIPMNYNRLCEELVKQRIETSSDLLQPAFASVADTVYPGMAILGDARALTGILLQQQVLAPQNRERTGWVVFAGESLKHGGSVEIQIDFGTGMRRFTFLIPAP